MWCVLYDCFFFFKQKTAYEMRISDWSSDVCSSDLRRHLPALHLGDAAEGVQDEDLDRFAVAAGLDGGRAGVAGGGADDGGAGAALDRKSVVEGKSVSVRVDLGGRRILKKQK